MQGPISGWQQQGDQGQMFIYVPDNLADNPPILVALTYCGGTASAIFSTAKSGGVVSAADQQGFIILLPQQPGNCWDVGTTPALTHDGGSDTLEIVHQVKYTIDQYGGNPDRVYAMGQSGGAMAVEALLAVYPDVFKGGVEFSGVPAGCWAVGNMTDGEWSSACANGQVTHTAQEWGDIARAMYPDYSGTFRPRIQLWHGDADGTINFNNQGEAIKQWQNVLGVGDTPDASSTVMVNGKTFKRDEYKDDCGMTVLDVMTEPGGPHNTSATMTAQYTLGFLGLDMAGDTDPQATSECWTSGGNSGSGGTGNSGAGGSDNSGAGGSSGPGAGGGTGNPGAGGTGVGDGSGGANTTSAGGSSTTGSGGGNGTSTGGSSGPGTGGSPGTTDTGSTDGGDGSSTGSKGCTYGMKNNSSSFSALALAGLFALMLGRRRYKRFA